MFEFKDDDLTFMAHFSRTDTEEKSADFETPAEKVTYLGDGVWMVDNADIAEFRGWKVVRQ